MFEKILVANRGEIALRVLRACREMGIGTVAVYSEADANSAHVHYADEAVCIGGSAAVHSYLNMAALLEAASQTGADAIHPGYGFLSESAQFASVCKAWGLGFIGPRAETIELMGCKSTARQLMKNSGVPVVPGIDIRGMEDREILEAAISIGFPVLVKAAAGGGGRGIRIAHDAKSLREAVATARRETAASFGDSSLYLEKSLTRPRHIEIQVLADHHGTILHLFERESSIQRRRQKVLEEAPSPALDEKLRHGIAETAVKAAAAVQYTNAGTVEFLLDADGTFYFIEMNTRIQVEHPVTEAILGVDLVKEQIRIAAGEPLRFRQEDIVPRGHAIEMRINAEDPNNRFLPSPGRITRYREPSGPGVRIDSYVNEGSEILPYYDSLVAKLIVWASNREEAIQRAQRALSEYCIEGIHTTLPMHQALLADPEFKQGNYNTWFLEEWLDTRSA